MTDTPGPHRFYGDLAVWWPLMSPPAEYAEEAAFAATVLRSAAIPVREVLELGSGGGHNAAHLKASFAMTLVDLSDEMLDVSRRLNPECDHHRGDMRTVRLGCGFDAVFVHDAVDPDPEDTWAVTEYAFLIRDVDGSIRVVHETHRLGLFGRDDWLRLLAEAGFDPRVVTEVTSEDRTPRELFVGQRPAA